MRWTNEQKLEELPRLPWTIIPDVTPEGDRLLRVAEIPSAVGSGGTDEELERDLWDSLRASLIAYLHFGDPIPLPSGSIPPWVSPPEGAPRATRIRFERTPTSVHVVRDPAQTAVSREIRETPLLVDA